MIDVDPLDGADELCRLSAAQLADCFARRALSPVDVAIAAMERAQAVNADLNAFTVIDWDGALEAARASESRWRSAGPLSPIDGVPATIKDIVCVEGWSTRYGSLSMPETPQTFDAPSVSALRKAGVVFIAQTTTPEFGWKAVTDSPLSGVTRNPWNRLKTPGGSSGGAAVAAAVGAGTLHLGTDGGGSIRIPASFTGIVGHKPTFGRVAAYPPSAFGTLAHIGPMARRVEDASLMLAAMSGRDLRDWAQGAGSLSPLGMTRPVELAGLKIGYWSKPAVGRLCAEVGAAADRAINALADAGARIQPVELPAGDLLDIFNRHWFSGAALRVAGIPPAELGHVDPGLLEIAAIGAAYTSKEVVAAQVRRAQFGASMDQLLAEHDVLLSPGTPLTAFDAGLEVPHGSGYSRWTEWAGFSFPINLSQQPACVVPIQRDSSGLPIGLQIVGARGDDAGVLSAAACVVSILSR